MDSSLISIIIPVYNRETILNTTLDSIINQTYSNWECLLVDDGSTDNTYQTINNYVQRDNRFKYFKRPDDLPKGANACRNYGFAKTKGVFINWFDSDDLMEVNFLEEKINAFKPNTDAVLHRNRYANYYLTRFRESKFRHDGPEILFSTYALEDIEIQTSGFMWKKEYLKDKPLFNEDIQRYQDNEFHIRMLALQPKVQILDTVLATIRGGDGDPSQISSKQNLNKKKLYDVFYYRYLTLKLNKLFEGEWHKKINKIVSKKALWSFYDFLRFEKNIFIRLKDVIKNYRKLKIVYFNKGLSLKENIQSHLYLCYLIIFGSTFYKNKT